jgi:uncharacterized membrane protein (UPF0127 family)
MPDLLLSARRLDGVPIAERVRTARSFRQRLIGLMGRKSLEPGEALWFPGESSIHMLFMRMPIDVLFLSEPEADGARVVMDLRHSLPAWRGVVWASRRAKGCLELEAGVLARCGIKVGDRILLD